MPDFCPASSTSPPRRAPGSPTRRSRSRARPRPDRSSGGRGAGAAVDVAGRELLDQTMRPSSGPARPRRRSSRWPAPCSCRRWRRRERRALHRRSASTKRRRPEGPKSGAPRRLAELARLDRQVGLPKPRAVADPQRDDAAAERAARILGIARPRLLPRRHRHVHDAVVHGRCGRQARGVVRLDVDLPDSAPVSAWRA